MKRRILDYRPVTWFILANRCDAIIYGDKKKKPFYFIERLENENGKKSEYQLVADREGRVGSSASRTIRHALEPKESKHDHLANLFAKRIADYLERASEKKLFDNLVLVSGPRFLGMLRKALKPQISSLIIHEVKREYLQGSDAQIKKLILNAIPMDEGHLSL